MRERNDEHVEFTHTMARRVEIQLKCTLKKLMILYPLGQVEETKRVQYLIPAGY
jgi:hypothetical protein